MDCRLPISSDSSPELPHPRRVAGLQDAHLNRPLQVLLLEAELLPSSTYTHRPSNVVLGTQGPHRLQRLARGLKMRQVEYALLRSPGTNSRNVFPLGSCAMGPDSKVTIFQPNEAEPTRTQGGSGGLMVTGWRFVCAGVCYCDKGVTIV